MQHILSVACLGPQKNPAPAMRALGLHDPSEYFQSLPIFDRTIARREESLDVLSTHTRGACDTQRLQAGLLAYGRRGFDRNQNQPCRLRLLSRRGDQWLMQPTNPITAAGPRWIRTTLPSFTSAHEAETCNRARLHLSRGMVTTTRGMSRADNHVCLG